VDARHAPCLDLELIYGVPGLQGADNATGTSPTTVIPFHRRSTSIVPPHNDTYGDKLTNQLSLSEQLIDM
jgi:hypothetical protein